MPYTKDDFHREVVRDFFFAMKPEDIVDLLSPTQLRTLAERVTGRIEQWPIIKGIMELRASRPTTRRPRKARTTA